MPSPKGIATPAVREHFLADRRTRLAEFDRLYASGNTMEQAARAVGFTRAGVHAARRSVEHLSVDAPVHGGAKATARIDLGLALLSIARKPDEPLSLEDMAAWCACSPNALFHIEQRAPRKLRRRLLDSVAGTDLAEEVEALFGGKTLMAA